MNDCYYTLDKFQKENPVATAATVSCGLCGKVVSGSGGPAKAICGDCYGLLQVNVFLTKDVITYMAFSTGLDNKGNKITVALDKWHDDCGCNPYHWANCSKGYGFSTVEEAKHQIKYARLSYNVKKINEADIHIIEYKKKVLVSNNYYNIDRVIL